MGTRAIALAERIRREPRDAALGDELAGEVLRDVEQARCEGYTNYATSSVALTLENDRKLSAGLARLVEVAVKAAPAAEAVRDGTWSVEEATRFQLADFLKEYVERLMEQGIRDGEAGLVASAMVRNRQPVGCAVSRRRSSWAPALACHPPRHRIGSAVCVVKHHGKVKPCPHYRERWSSWS